MDRAKITKWQLVQTIRGMKPDQKYLSHMDKSSLLDLYDQLVFQNLLKEMEEESKKLSCKCHCQSNQSLTTINQ